MHSELFDVRKTWYEAYIAGDVHRLEVLQSADFKVVGPAGVEDKAEQLAGIAAAVRTGKWFPMGGQAVDDQLSWRAISEDVVEAVGIGKIVTPTGYGPLVSFIELWGRSGATWQAIQLHYSETRP